MTAIQVASDLHCQRAQQLTYYRGLHRKQSNLSLFPGIATSKDAVQALAQRFAMQTVVDVLEIEGRRALLPDFVISNILGQLQVNTTYEPLQCQLLMGPGETQ
ncbi:hypothetical protein KIN20_028324 [Parelaphostrongylus tenuis]|uniref:Uncharacterized protein n=1 Tax=Parelaphostrongylus tenuis TaxID=148309 RepID=A0AAD5WEP8_PARTN|nr:hypothetical protein KIN20_028324 [Parelaphostrongylus tenuis]